MSAALHDEHTGAGHGGSGRAAQGTHLASGFVRGAGKVQRAGVCGCAAHGEPHSLRLVVVHSPVVGVRVHVGKCLIQLE